MELIKKDIIPSLQKVVKLMEPSCFTIKCNKHYLDSKTLTIKKESREYGFELEPSAVNDLEAFPFSPDTVIELFNENSTLFFQGEKLFLNKISHDTNLNEIGSGSLSELTTTSSAKSFDDKYLRQVIPVGEKNKAPDLTDFEIRGYVTPQNLQTFLVCCSVSNEKFHIYTHKLNKQEFLVIDCLNKTSIDIFKQKCYCILLALGFITGQLTLNETYILSFEDEAMQAPLNIKYSSSSPSISTKTSVFESYIYTHNTNSKEEIKGDSENKKEDGKKYIFRFPEQVFSNLVTLFFNHDELERAAILLIHGNSITLELALPGYYVAIEAIAQYFKKNVFTNKQDSTPIKDKKIARELRQKMLEIAKEIKTESKLGDGEFDLKTIEAKINDMNKLTNRAALSKPFEHFGYTLLVGEQPTLTERNTYLHGRYHGNSSSPVRLKESIHLEARLNFMIDFLLLKLAGFSGKVINHAKRWSETTSKASNEDEFIDI
ncbi:hypothetical protein [Microscilla marina]|uniref:ApeA N-terminal domain-containing protein n=1 Tax=Microscilla marina ATCC 23134 TaxID=313606 RepID=A1ZZX1_MICM2|nr:hypothetical protein [Microscilla marina]EAY24059.1 hypothetical protein M23134_01543 [Microscilla marina ATCC 23134]